MSVQGATDPEPNRVGLGHEMEQATLDAPRLVPLECGADGGQVHPDDWQLLLVCVPLVDSWDLVVAARDDPQLRAEHQLAAQWCGPHYLTASTVRHRAEHVMATETKPPADL